jgi:hypothetical protein
MLTSAPSCESESENVDNLSDVAKPQPLQFAVAEPPTRELETKRNVFVTICPSVEKAHPSGHSLNCLTDCLLQRDPILTDSASHGYV